MVNDFTNINKTNNLISLQLIEHIKSPWHMMLEIQVLAGTGIEMWWNLIQLMRCEPSLFDNGISNGNAYINKWLKKTCTDSLPLKKTTYYHEN
jgi:hypothetical protein